MASVQMTIQKTLMQNSCDSFVLQHKHIDFSEQSFLFLCPLSEHISFPCADIVVAICQNVFICGSTQISVAMLSALCILFCVHIVFQQMCCFQFCHLLQTFNANMIFEPQKLCLDSTLFCTSSKKKVDNKSEPLRNFFFVCN